MAERADSADIDCNTPEQAEKGEESTQANAEVDVIDETQSIGPGSDTREGSDDIDHHVRMIGGNEFAEKFLVDLYLLADKLLDFVTANMVIGKLIRLSEGKDEKPSRLRSLPTEARKTTTIRRSTKLLV